LSAHRDREDACDELRGARRESAPSPGLEIASSERGDNLAASFSPELVDASIHSSMSPAATRFRARAVRVTRSDLLVSTRSICAHVGASLEVMARDAQAIAARGRSVTTISNGRWSDSVIAWIKRDSFTKGNE